MFFLCTVTMKSPKPHCPFRQPALSTCNSINQERRTACVLANRIYTEATKRKAIRKFLFSRRFSVEERNFLSVTHKFSLFYSLFRIGKSFFSSFLLLVLEKFSINILSQYCPRLFLSRKPFSSFLHYQYIACGV